MSPNQKQSKPNYRASVTDAAQTDIKSPKSNADLGDQ